MTRRPAWYTADDARADRAARYGTAANASTHGRPAGVLAWDDQSCGVCDELIQAQVHQITMRKQRWVHVQCVNGWEDGHE